MPTRRHSLLAAAGCVVGPAFGQAAPPLQVSDAMTQMQSTSEVLPARLQAIVPIAALAAAGDIARLGPALGRGLDKGMTISDAREVLVQLYAYAGFPRSLNALGELMKLVDDRKQRGIEDAPGREPGRAIPKGDALMAAGTANQTRLVGAPVAGALFDFAPVANDYLRAHLFGDIFERDNLDWQTREIATVAMLSALPGAEAQLQSHMGIGMNIGLTVAQLTEVCRLLADEVDAQAAGRANEALARRLSARPAA